MLSGLLYSAFLTVMIDYDLLLNATLVGVIIIFVTAAIALFIARKASRTADMALDELKRLNQKLAEFEGINDRDKTSLNH